MSAQVAVQDNQINGIQINPSNTLIQHLLTESGTIKNLFAFFIDSDGEVANIPIQVNLFALNTFIEQFKNAYVVFRDEENQLLFEVSDSLLCYISQDIEIKRCDIREILYLSGMKNIR